MSTEIYKTLLVGPPSTGKTSLMRAYLLGKFDETYTATVGVDMSPAMLEFPDGKVVLTIVDLGGQESFTLMRSRFFAGAHHVIFVYDITDKATFEQVSKWYETLSSGICLPQGVALGGSLVGNKVDLEDKRQISTDDGNVLANLLSLKFFETSAKTGHQVAELFIHAASVSREKVRR